MLDELLHRGAEQCIAVVPQPPTANCCDAAATQQYDYNNGDDNGQIAFLGRFRGNGHFVHDFFSLKKMFS
jgi:hypothetical protein